MGEVKIFGDSASFAIRCAPSGDSASALAYCVHWVLNGKLIGDENEACYLPSWIAALEHFKLRKLPEIKASSISLSAENIQMIFGYSVGVEWPEERREVHENGTAVHWINLDETQDAWLLMIHQENEHIVFNWQGQRVPCLVEDIGRIFNLQTTYRIVIQAIDECLAYFESL